MTKLIPASYLRQGLLANATTNLGLALFMLLAAGMLAEKLWLPASVLFFAGSGLLVASILLGYLSLKQTISDGMVAAVIGFNVLWAIGSLVLLAGGLVEPSRTGMVLIVTQAAVAAMYAWLQTIGLRQSKVAAA
jgi:hypothetical protein